MAKRKHPFPSRTRQLSSSAPMVLLGRPGGRVGRRREHILSPDLYDSGLFFFLAGGNIAGDRWYCQELNVECRTGKRRMQKGLTSTFEIPCSMFCGSKVTLAEQVATLAAVSSNGAKCGQESEAGEDPGDIQKKDFRKSP